MPKKRILKKVAKRPAVSNSRYVDAYGDRYWRIRYVAQRVVRGKVRRVIRFCRVMDFDIPDPMGDAMGAPMDELRADMLRRDVRSGCPMCRGFVEDNASEPDVLGRFLHA